MMAEQPDLTAPTNDELLRLIIDSATDFAIFTIDPNGIVGSWNRGAERLLGYSDAEIIGQTADVIFPREAGGFNGAEEERRVASLAGRAEDERWQVRKDGTRFWASGLLMPLSDQKLGFVKILRDRTQQHLAEERLAHNEEQFRVLATNIPQLVFRCRADGERTWGSPQWSVFTGLNLPQSLQFGWLNAVHPDDRELTVQAWNDAQFKGEYYVEHRIRRAADGEYRWHQTRARPINVSMGEASGEWVGTSTDVHDMRDLQDRQMVLVAELQHRTRNLLAVVQSIGTQTLRSSADVQEFSAKFHGRLQALSRVQGILAGTSDSTVDLRNLVEAEIAAHSSAADYASKVTIEGEHALIQAKAAQAFALALHELATNSLKYGALGQRRGQLVIKWTVQRHDGEPTGIELHWHETGITVSEQLPTRRKGYGRELIERALPYQLGARTNLTFERDAVSCIISAPIAAAERLTS